MNMRVAFASQDGKIMNDCCLKSSRWWIYEVGEDIRFLGQRMFHDECDTFCDTCGDRLMKVLGDCDLLFVQNADANMSHCVLSYGKQVINANQSISDLLKFISEFRRKEMSLEYFRRINQVSQTYGRIA